MIKLRELLGNIDYRTEISIENIMARDIVIDSRLVQKDDLFVAISGTVKDGHIYINEALERGACAIILEKNLEIPKKIKVGNTRKILALLARNMYKDPSRQINVVGITGTNGKTTVSYLIDSIIKSAGLKAGIIGTVRYKAGDEISEPDNTTPSPLLLQALIRKMVDKSLEYCVMEVSSHALDQHRADCIDFNTAIFTNATREHLDYHKDFINYLNSKMELFKKLKPDGIAIINRDDPNYSAVAAATKAKIISFGMNKDSDVYVEDIRLNFSGTKFALRAKNSTIPIESSLIGMYNVSNILAAASFALSEKIDPDVIKNGIEDLKIIPGRLQLLDAGAPIKVFVDYAHTDDALKKVLTALDRLKTRKIITLFGCGGNRDTAKRPRMASVAAGLSDYVVITSDNPRYEAPEEIIKDIVKGIPEDFRDYKVVPDREKAIEEAMALAQEDDIVLIAGKGHETYQIIGSDKIPFSDICVAKEILEKTKKSVGRV